MAQSRNFGASGGWAESLPRNVDWKKSRLAPTDLAFQFAQHYSDALTFYGMAPPDFIGWDKLRSFMDAKKCGYLNHRDGKNTKRTTGWTTHRIELGVTPSEKLARFPYVVPNGTPNEHETEVLRGLLLDSLGSIMPGDYRDGGIIKQASEAVLLMLCGGYFQKYQGGQQMEQPYSEFSREWGLVRPAPYNWIRNRWYDQDSPEWDAVRGTIWNYWRVGCNHRILWELQRLRYLEAIPSETCQESAPFTPSRYLSWLYIPSPLLYKALGIPTETVASQPAGTMGAKPYWMDFAGALPRLVGNKWFGDPTEEQLFLIQFTESVDETPVELARQWRAFADRALSQENYA